MTLPSADTFFEIPLPGVGGVVPADTAAVLGDIRNSELETAGVHDQIGVHGLDVLTPPTPPTPPPIEPTLPDSTHVQEREPATQPAAQTTQPTGREQRRLPVPTERMVTRSSRAGEVAFVVSNGSDTATTDSTHGPTHSVDEVLKR